MRCFQRGHPLYTALSIWLSTGPRDITTPRTKTKTRRRPIIPGCFCTLRDIFKKIFEIIVIQFPVPLPIHLPDTGTAMRMRTIENNMCRINTRGRVNSASYLFGALVKAQNLGTDNKQRRLTIVYRNCSSLQRMINFSRRLLPRREPGQINPHGRGNIDSANADLIGMIGR